MTDRDELIRADMGPGHDPLCPLAVGRLADTGPLAYCQCDLIANVRPKEGSDD